MEMLLCQSQHDCSSLDDAVGSWDKYKHWTDNILCGFTWVRQLNGSDGDFP